MLCFREFFQRRQNIRRPRSSDQLTGERQATNVYHVIISSKKIIIVMMMKIKLFCTLCFHVLYRPAQGTPTSIFRIMNFYGNGHVHENKQQLIVHYVRGFTLCTPLSSIQSLHTCTRQARSKKFLCAFSARSYDSENKQANILLIRRYLSVRCTSSIIPKIACSAVRR